jgi:hypothetical protein
MANTELRTFLEDRLRVLDSSLDLSAGSPAQVEFIDPVLAYLGTDPFETDIEKFLVDRLTQEFPDIFSGDPGAYRDLFIKPLITFLTPFKRETQAIRQSQSLRDPSILSDDDADALVANWFDSRSLGGFATGAVRIYFSNPTNLTVELSTRFYTTDGKNYFPDYPITITAEQMVFNRQGALYFADIQIKSEKEGSDYNVGVGEIVGVEGIFGALKVTNIRSISSGSDTLSTTALVAQTEASLTERSMVTPRGASARIRELYQGQARAIQIIGAKDVEMKRDILFGTSTGHAWITGQVFLYETLALIQCRTIEGSAQPAAGDQIFIYKDSSRWATTGVVRLTIEEVLSSSFPGGTGFENAYLLRWSGTLPSDITLPLAFEGGLVRDTSITITSETDLHGDPINIVSGGVHIYGKTDIYARPVQQVDSKAVLSNLVDSEALVERPYLRLDPSWPSPKNLLVDNGPAELTPFDFAANGVRVGDTLTIETTEIAGTYKILKVDQYVLYVGVPFVTNPGLPMRYRITRVATIDSFDPIIPKLPFGDSVTSDLQAVIGSTLFQVGTNTVDYGVRIGDTVRLLTGLNAGDYTIMGFDAVLGGKGLIVDRKAAASAGSIGYEIFTTLEKIEKPLVRIKEISLLDSSKKSTGVTIPPADPVATIPVTAFTTAQPQGSSHLMSGFVLPAMMTGTADAYVGGGSVDAANVLGNDNRYSRQIEDDEDGIYKAMLFDDAVQGELLFPPDADSKCCYFLMTVEDFLASSNYPPYQEPRVNDSLTIKSGPNKGSYLIRQVRKFKYRKDAQANWIYLIKIHGSFPVDTFRHLITFLEDNGQTVTKIVSASAIAFPDFFTSFYAGLGAALHLAIHHAFPGSTPPDAATLQDVADSLLSTKYEWGVPSHGTLRTLFQQPTLFVQQTANADEATVFEYISDSGEVVQFRPNPDLYKTQLLYPARGVEVPSVVDYPRDIVVAGSLATFEQTDKPTMFSLGVLTGDVLEVYEETFLWGDTATREAVTLSLGSPKVVAPNGSAFSSMNVGNYLSIEEGSEAGMYVITDVIDSATVLLDRAPSASTAAIIKKFAAADWGWDGTRNVIEVPDTELGFFNGLAGKWATLYRAFADPLGTYWDGAYKILSVEDIVTSPLTPGNQRRAVIECATAIEMPTFGTNDPAPIVVVNAPSIFPSSKMGVASQGAELLGAVPIRLYRDVPTQFPITAVRDTLIDGQAQSTLTVTGTFIDGRYEPYAIFRSNVRRISPQEMQPNIQGVFFYCDTEVVSLTSNGSANLQRESYLTLKEGTYETQGYRHRVADPALSYSMRETGVLDLPTRILPTFSDDRADGELTVLGSPIQITYERSDLVKQLQDFVDSADERVTSADMLTRHFLPSYVSFEASYYGGSATSVVAKDIIDYIDTRPVSVAVDVSEVQGLITARGGNPETPLTVQVVTHDWKRRMWAEFSQNSIGGSVTKVPYDGTPRVTFYVPGKDTSGQTVQPYGERITLTKL